MTPPGPPTRSHPLVVLVVEDDQDHAALIQAVFAYTRIRCRFHITGSSEEAMDYLLGAWPYDDRDRHPLPDVIILDLGLPGMDGLGFLRWMGDRDESWARTPVVVFTSSTDDRTVAEATRLGAREVRVKPAGFPQLVEAVEGILERWRTDIA